MCEIYYLNILYISQFFSVTRGGGEAIFYDFAKGMSERGHQVDIISHQITNSSEHLDGVTIHRIGPAIEHKGGLPPSIKQNLMYIINGIRKGSQIIRQNKVEIIHTNNFSPVIVGSILGSIYHIPVVSTIHDIFSKNSPDGWKKWAAQNNVSRISSLIGPLFEKITIKMPVDAIHTVSNTSKQDIINFEPKSSDSIIVIPNGIHLKDYDGMCIDYQSYVLFIGRLVYYKNLDTVISSFKNVVNNVPHAKLVVVGDGPMRDKWEKMVTKLNLAKNILFTGYISHARKLELLSKCCALLMPSTIEGFGLVLLEAFAMKKPVLVANIKPYDEIVEDKTDGFMLSAYDQEEWSDKITFILSNKNVCENMGIKGRLKVENRFNIYEVLDKVESLYVNLCSNKQGMVNP
jgi:glycosyltransferase involved in cell wall biosynthesis